MVLPKKNRKIVGFWIVKENIQAKSSWDMGNGRRGETEALKSEHWLDNY